MPVFLLTLHTYRSWSENHPKGYVQRGKPGVQPPSAGMAHYRDSLAKKAPRQLAAGQQQIAVNTARDVCDAIDITAYACSCTTTHLQVLVGWPHEADCTPDRVATRLKRVIGCQLSAAIKKTSQKWFSRGWDSSQVKDQKHFGHLLNRYLPKHKSEGGIVVIWEKPSETPH